MCSSTSTIVFVYFVTFLFRRSVRLHKIHRATPVDPGDVRILGQMFQLAGRKRYVDNVVELTKVVVQGLTDGKDGGASSLIIVFYICLRYLVFFVLGEMESLRLLGRDGGGSVVGNITSCS